MPRNSTAIVVAVVVVVTGVVARKGSLMTTSVTERVPQGGALTSEVKGYSVVVP